MNIAQIHWAFPPVIGGVESPLAMLGPELIKNNCQVSLLAGAAEGSEGEDRSEEMYIRRTPLLYKISDLCVCPSCFEEPFGLVFKTT